MDEVGSGITGLVGLARADVVGIRRAVELDELVGVGEFLPADGGSEVGEGVLLAKLSNGLSL